MKQQKEHHLSDVLWVLVKLKDSVYAIDSANVVAIFQLDQPVTDSVKSSEAHLGVIPFRGGILPLIDLRRLIGMQSFAEEEDAFEEMLEQRKHDHIHWVEELKRCLTTDEKFGLATDPHKCAFGKWYDSYEPANQTVAFHLRRIEEPHKKLHETAAETFSCVRNCDQCHREECLQVSLKNGADLYMPQVVKLLDEAKQVFKESYRRMIVVISQGDVTCGLVIDEVLSVENLDNIVVNSNFGSYEGQKSVSHIATKKNDADLILVFNLENIFQMRLEVEPSVDTVG